MAQTINAKFKKKVSKNGGSLCINIPTRYIKSLRIRKGTELEVVLVKRVRG